VSDHQPTQIFFRDSGNGRIRLSGITDETKGDYKWCERFLPTNLCNRSHHL